MSVTKEDVKDLTGWDLLESWEYWTPDPEDIQYEVNLSVMDMVREYATTSGQKPNVAMSFRLVQEEFEEWCDGVEPEDFEGELKELADLVYVIYGYANVMQWDLDEAIRRVHENNMGRMFQEDGTIKRREDGKIIKRPGYPKVDLGDLV